MKKWLAFMDKFYPEGDKNSSFNTYGYSAAQLLEVVLRQCGDDLTRENILKQATNLKNIHLDLWLQELLAAPLQPIIASTSNFR